MSGSSGDRFVVQARLLGSDDSRKNRKKSEKEFALDVTLSDESSYVIFRTVKEIANLHTKLVAQFPVEAGYFNKKETVIPSCPLKMTIFGPSRLVREDRIFEKLLNSYIKELPAMPASIVKSDLINKFFQLRPSDMSEPGETPKKPEKKRQKSEPIRLTADSSITGPMRLRSYYAVAAYNDSKTKFKFEEGAVLQVLQKDPSGATGSGTGSSLILYQCLARYKGSDSSELTFNKNDTVKVLDKKDHGWWYVEDMHGRAGWAPATYLGPVVDHSKTANPRASTIVGSVREVRETYSAQQKDELTVSRGDKVTVLSAPDDGWWIVCNMSNMEQGLVPSVCLSEVTSEADDREQPSAEILESIKELSQALESQEKAASEANGGGDEEEEEEGEGEEYDEQDASDTYSYRSDLEDELMDGACYISTVTYHKQAQDELSVHEGQVVCVVDDSDKSMYYVMVDGKEGWVPSDILKMAPGSGGWSISSSVSSLNSHGQSYSRSISPSPMPSRSPSPMDFSEFPDSPRGMPHYSSSTHSAPSRAYLKPTPVKRQMASRTKSLETSSRQTSAPSTPLQIHVEETASAEDIEQAAIEAERMAEEAQRRAAELRERAKQAQRSSSATPKDS